VKTKPTVLLVDDDPTFRHVMAGELERLDLEVHAVGSGADAIRAVATHSPQVVILDLQLPDASGLDVLQTVRQTHPGIEVIMLTGHGSLDTAIESIKMGAFDYVAKPCPLDEIELRIGRALERQSLRKRTDLLERGLTPPDLGSSFVGHSPEYHRILHLIDRVAPTDSTVLISGETGSGKEMVAKLIHARSLRKSRPFVVVECAALQESLLQSELFGHERGAFTGADREKSGLFEVANKGTIFLDEIGEVSLATQVKLLRVLDAGTFRRVGGTAEIRVDVRILAATNRDMPALVRQGLFREDLFFRLNTIRLEIPPLRQRRADIDLLATYFLSLLNDRFGVRRQLGADTMEVLLRYDWPGNVRELLHVLEAAMVVCEGTEVRPEHLPAAVRLSQPAATPHTSAGNSRLPTLEELERAHIELALRTTGGHRGNAAKILGISERNLYRKLREYLMA
jgi:DNA-binding NtrC family response regulator